MDRPGRQAGVQTVHKAIAILRLFLETDGNGMAAKDFASKCRFPRSTAYRLLSALRAEGLIDEAPGGGRYYPGPLLYELGLLAYPRLGIRESCNDIVQRTARMAGATCFLTLRSGLDGLCVDRSEVDSTLNARDVDIGTRRPLGIGLGSIAILSALSFDEAERIMKANSERYAQSSRFGISHVKSMVARTRRRGYAYTSNDYIDDIGGFAVAVGPLAGGLGNAAISVAARVEAMPLSRAPEILPLLSAASEELRARLGFAEPACVVPA
ncbi:MAG: IclR family transcriptional regulator [Burkholderiaceae bacterium]